KNKDPIEEHSLIPATKGAIPCKGVGVQTDEHVLVTDLTIEKSLSVSRKLAGIWEPLSDQQPRVNLVSKLFVACEADLQFLFGCLGLNMPSTKATFTMTPNHCIQPVEAEKVSHLYLTLTKTSYDTGGLDDLLEALVDLCCLQNYLANLLLSSGKALDLLTGVKDSNLTRSLCILHVVLKHILSIENRLCGRDNVIVNDPSAVNRSSGKHADIEYLLHESTNKTSNAQHSVLTRLISAEKIWNKDSLRDESSPLISCSKWLSLYQYMHQIITKHSEESLRMEAVSIMNILLIRTDAYAEREMYGVVPVFQSISQLLRKEAGVGVQKQTVHLLYLLLNCPNLDVIVHLSGLWPEVFLADINILFSTAWACYLLCCGVLGLCMAVMIVFIAGAWGGAILGWGSTYTVDWDGSALGVLFLDGEGGGKGISVLEVLERGRD
ncbi:hypothetical protein Tco_0191182, partial [Tanacetum coccineum]